MIRSYDVYLLVYPPDSIAQAVALLAKDPRFAVWARQRGLMDEGRLHITLQKLGSFIDRVPRDLLDRAKAVGDAVVDEPFGVAFDLLQARGEGGTLELAARGPGALGLRRFQRSLGDVMRRQGFEEREIHEHFNPHITLHYNFSGVVREVIAPLAWTVTKLHLVVSLNGKSKHEVHADWPLIARQQGFGDW